MKTYQKPTAEIVELKLEDVISSSSEPEPSGNANTGTSTCSPINLPCHSQEGNQPAC